MLFKIIYNNGDGRKHGFGKEFGGYLIERYLSIVSLFFMPKE